MLSLKVFVFTSLSLQFNFHVHPCILISQDLLLIIFFSKYQSLSLPVMKWSVRETYISSPSIFSLLSFLELFSNFFLELFQGSSYRSEVECYITSCLDCCFILGFTPFLVSFRFVYFWFKAKLKQKKFTFE